MPIKIFVIRAILFLSAVFVVWYIAKKIKKKHKRPTSAEIDTSYRGPGNLK